VCVERGHSAGEAHERRWWMVGGRDQWLQGTLSLFICQTGKWRK